MDVNGNLLKLTADIVSAHAAGNQAPSGELAGLIRSVYETLESTAAVSPEAPQEPAVPIKRSVFPDYIICLEDGKKLKMLKRHLSKAFGMTVDEYRSKWGLPQSYPMVAPSYAEHRSFLAKKIGLGRRPEMPSPEPVARHIREGKSDQRKRGRRSPPK